MNTNYKMNEIQGNYIQKMNKIQGCFQDREGYLVNKFMVESASGVSPEAAHGTVREPLGSYGSC